LGWGFIFDIENVRIELRDLIKLIEPTGGNVVANLQDEIVSIIEGRRLDEYETADENYKNKVNQYIIAHKDHLAIHKLANNMPLNISDYKELEKILWHELGTKDDYEKEYANTALGELVRSITGLTQEAANLAFSEYLNNQSLTAPQINYIKTIVDYVVRNGYIKDNSELAEQPFTTIGRITQIFPTVDAMKIMKIIEAIKDNAFKIAN